MSNPGNPTEGLWWNAAGLEGLWGQVAQRLERNGIRAEGRIRIKDLDRGQRHAVGDLLGCTVTSDRVSLDLADLDERLRVRAGLGLADAAGVVLRRPLVDRRATRAQLQMHRAAPDQALTDWMDAHPGLEWPWASGWLQALRRDGVLGRADDPAGLVVRALEILHHQREFLVSGDRERAQSPVARSALAATTCHDAHALDDDRRLAGVVLRAAASLDEGPPPADARDRRELWERIGVVTDLVSSTCLVWRLPLSVRHGHETQSAIDTSGPTHVTWWAIRHGVTVAPTGRVLVCENPAVLEAVALADPDVAVVCTSGRPNLVTARILGRTAEAGGSLIYHGDFDWPGLAMATDAMRRYGARPWRMDVGDYESAAGDLPLKGTPGGSPWDPELAAAMRRRGVAVHEEAVLEDLVSSLR